MFSKTKGCYEWRRRLYPFFHVSLNSLVQIISKNDPDRQGLTLDDHRVDIDLLQLAQIDNVGFMNPDKLGGRKYLRQAGEVHPDQQGFVRAKQLKIVSIFLKVFDRIDLHLEKGSPAF